MFAMAFGAEFFRLLFAHGHESLVVRIMRQPGRSFRRRIPEKQEDPGTEDEKERIVDQYLFFAVHGIHTIVPRLSVIEEKGSAVLSYRWRF